MRRSQGLTVRAFGAALLLLALAACSPERSCAVCGRAECTNLAFSIELRDGKTVETCCPRCGLHYIRSEHADVVALTAHAFESAEALPAEQAFYVEGSDVTPCVAMHAERPRDARGCCLQPVYDRCLPSLLAFASRADAEAFARREGGAIKTFAEIVAAAR